MKQTGMVRLQKEINERVYSFDMQIGAPYGETYDVLFDMMQEIVKLSKEAADRIERVSEKKEDEASVEEIKEAN